MRRILKADQKSVSLNIVIILILFSLTTIFGCKWGSWSFDLFGGDPINGDDGDSGDNGDGGDGGDGNGIALFVVPVDGISAEFPPAVFSANIGGTKINEPVELFSSFEDGFDITELTGVINRGGAGDEFKVSPDGTLVAYLTEENSEGGTETRISQLPSNDADVFEFDWSPDGTRIAYLADGEIDGRVELYTNLAEGGENRKVSSSLPPGGKVQAFEWSPDSSLLAYTADQNNLGEFELFTTPPTEKDPVQVSGNVLPNNGDVTEFSWSPGNTRIAYLSNQRLAGVVDLFTSLPRRSDDPDQISEGDSIRDFAWAPDEVDERLAYSTNRIIFTAPPNGGGSTQVTPGLTVGGSISDFSWAPDSSRIAYRANQRFVGTIELFAVEPDGSDKDDIDKPPISGDLTGGGNVTDFVWSPNSRFVAYRANQDSAVTFELYVTTPDGSSSDTKVSGDSMAGDVEPIFAWSPDSTRVAYRANQITTNAIELFTSTPDGQENDRVSGDLFSGGNVEEFKWAPDNSGIGYIADQENNEVFELFGSTPDGAETARLSGSFAEAGDVLFFEWVP